MSTPAAGTPAIEVHGLRKSFGATTVLDGISFTVPRGTVFALLGPNGAGKTTTVHILSTLLPADGGTAAVAGFDVGAAADEVRRSIGVTGQFSAVDRLLTASENLALMADLFHLDRPAGRRRTAELLEVFDLTDVKDAIVQTFSGGTKRRLDLAMTLVGEPRIIFLDEPTAGLDPRSRRRLWQIVRERVAAGVTVFLTTQYLEEADQLADRIAVLDGGRIIADGTPAELKARIPGGRARFRFDDAQALVSAAAVIEHGSADPGSLSLDIPTESDDLAGIRALLERLDGAGITPAGLTVQTADLDDVFLSLTGHSATGPAETEQQKAAAS